MKSIQFQKSTNKLLPYVFFCGLILLFTYGSTLGTGDMALSMRLGQGGFRSWIKEAGASGGNYLSSFLGAMMVDIPLLRHILVAGMLCTTLITLVFYSGAQKPYMYFVILFLGLAAPAKIFAYSFTGAVEPAVMLIPGFLTILYLFTVSDLFVYKGKKKMWKIPLLFVSGLTVQFFTESIGTSVLIMSVIFLICLWKKHGFSWHLGAHSFGCVLGFVFSMIIGGTRDAFSNSLFEISDRWTVALDQLFIDNILIMVLLTLACLLLIRPVRSQRSKNCNKTLALLLIPMGVFLLFYVINDAFVAFPTIVRVLSIVKLVASVMYSIGLLHTLCYYVKKDSIVYRVRCGILGLWIFIFAYSVTSTALPGMLYIPYLLLISFIVLLGTYSFRYYDHLEKVLGKPFFITAVAGVLAFAFVTMVNGKYFEVFDTHIREGLEAGNTEIVLPIAPYEDRMTNTDLTVLSEYYDFSACGNVELIYVPYADWDWDTYYEVHNVPSAEEYDEEAEETADWDHEFEED